MRAVVRVVLLLSLVSAAGVLRFSHNNWDQFQHVHPDERFIVWVADSISWPSDLATALDPLHSSINPFRWPPGQGDLAGKPRAYAYGHFPLYLLVGVAHLAQRVGQWFGETTLAFPPAFQPFYVVGRQLGTYDYLPLVGRAISAVADLGTLLLVYALAQRAYGGTSGQNTSPPAPLRGGEGGETTSPAAPLRNGEGRTASPPSLVGKGAGGLGSVAGLLAAGVYAFAVLPIQLSHFYAVDLVLTFCVVASVALAARWAERRAQGARRGGWALWLAAGAMAGLAVGSKFSAVLLVAPLTVAACYGLPPGDWARYLVVVMQRMAIVAATAAAVFLLTNPFALLEFVAYAGNIMAQNAMVSGLMDAPYTRQYIGTIPYLYFIQQLSQWGIGWPLGILAWGGFVWVVIQAGRRRVTPAQAVMVAWALPYFAFTGAFHAKFLRYMAPLLPFLAIFLAGGVLAVHRALRRWSLRQRSGQALRPPSPGTSGEKRGERSPHFALLAPRSWGAAVGLAAVFGVVWAIAFSGIYRQEHPWIQASRWLYENAPAESKLLTEYWDDALPLRLGEIAGRPALREYERVELPLWEPDTPAKLDRLVDELSSADYLILASDRLAGPIQRLPGRYPMSSQYYRLLFTGQLGYQPVAEFTAYPRLGSLVIADGHADESFTVYDHPHVRVFANTDRLSPGLIRARLGRYLPDATGRDSSAQTAGLRMTGDVTLIPVGWKGLAISPDPSAQTAVLRMTAEKPGPGPVMQPPRNPGRAAGLARLLPPEQAPAPDAPLTLDQPVDTLPEVADFRWNRFASGWPPAAMLLWWLVLSLMGCLAWLLLFPLMAGLSDRGWGLARVAGWLILGWVHWLGASLRLWENRTGALALLLLGFGLVGLLAGWVQRKQIMGFLREHRRLLLGEEALFAAAFVAFVVIRLLNPDLWQPWNGGEKFMEFAFLNAILRSAHFPPYDPYFAGGIINYYYFGLYLVSIVIKLTGIAAEVAFNLAGPSLFALTAGALFSVGHSLSSRRESCSPLAGGPHDSSAGSPPDGSRSRPALGGSLSVALALLMGNLAGLGEWLRGFVSLGGGTLSHDKLLVSYLSPLVRGAAAVLAGARLPSYDFWAPSRVIPSTINEFPFWTFLFADLHPHLIAMPFGILVVGMALNWAKQGERLAHGGWRRSLLVLATAGVIWAVTLGALGAINTWDLPVYFALVLGASIVAGWRQARFLGLWRLVVGITAQLFAAVAVGALALAAYWPFYAHYQAQVGGQTGPLLGRYLGWVRSATPFGPWIAVWGIFVFLVYSIVAVEWRRRQLATVPGVLAQAEMPEPEEDDVSAGGACATGSDEHLEPMTSADGGPQSEHRQEEDLDSEQASSSPKQSSRISARIELIALLGLLALSALLAALGRPTAALLAIPLGLALMLVFRGWVAAEESFLALVLAVGVAVVGAIELVYLRDFLEGGEWYRMNTMFKFSVPAWLLLGLAGGVYLPRLWAATTRQPVWLRRCWRSAAICLLAAGLAFLPLGVPSRLRDRFPGARPAVGTLDGMAFMTVGRFTWPDADHTIELSYDYLAIRWLLDNVKGTPVVAEAPAGGYVVLGQPMGYDYYRAAGLRVSSLTGLPTFVGHHQYEQRPGDQVGRRLELGQEFFQTESIPRTLELLSELRVGLIYVGAQERILFPAEGLRKFDAMTELGDLEVVYRNAQVTIYRVPDPRRL